MISFIKSKSEHTQTMILTAIACLTGVIPCFCIIVLSQLFSFTICEKITLTTIGTILLCAGMYLTTIIEKKIKPNKQ